MLISRKWACVGYNQGKELPAADQLRAEEPRLEVVARAGRITYQKADVKGRWGKIRTFKSLTKVAE